MSKVKIHGTTVPIKERVALGDQFTVLINRIDKLEWMLEKALKPKPGLFERIYDWLTGPR